MYRNVPHCMKGRINTVICINQTWKFVRWLTLNNVRTKSSLCGHKEVTASFFPPLWVHTLTEREVALPYSCTEIMRQEAACSSQREDRFILQPAPRKLTTKATTAQSFPTAGMEACRHRCKRVKSCIYNSVLTQNSPVLAKQHCLKLQLSYEKWQERSE